MTYSLPTTTNTLQTHHTLPLPTNTPQTLLTPVLSLQIRYKLDLLSSLLQT